MGSKKLKHRLEMIQDEVNTLRSFINSSRTLTDLFNQERDGAEKAITHLNNIEIACDLNDDESLRWTKQEESREGLKYFWQDVINLNSDIKSVAKFVWDTIPNRKEFLSNINPDFTDRLNFLFDEIENNDTLTFNTFKDYWEYKSVYFLEPDGQTTQQILGVWGMENQMLRQLIMSMPFDEVKGLFEERIEFEKNNPK